MLEQEKILPLSLLALSWCRLQQIWFQRHPFNQLGISCIANWANAQRVSSEKTPPSSNAQHKPQLTSQSRWNTFLSFQLDNRGRQERKSVQPPKDPRNDSGDVQTLWEAECRRILRLQIREKKHVPPTDNNAQPQTTSQNPRHGRSKEMQGLANRGRWFCRQHFLDSNGQNTDAGRGPGAEHLVSAQHIQHESSQVLCKIITHLHIGHL